MLKSLKSFGFRNYRAFLDQTTIELRPLTLLFGYNSTGKSALLRGLPLVCASLRGGSGAPINLDSAPARGCSFRELLTAPPLSASQHLGVDLAFQMEGRTIEVTSNLLDMPEAKTQIIEGFTVRDPAANLRWTASLNVSEKPQKVSHKHYDMALNNAPLGKVEIEFDGLLPSFEWPAVEDWDRLFSDHKPLSDLMSDLKHTRSLSTKVQWLSSVRYLPPRFTPYRGSRPKQLSPDGKGALDVLAYDALSDGDIIRDVSAWYEKHLRHKLLVLPEGDYFKIVLSPSDSPLQVNIADVGEGLIQVLPVLVSSAMLSNRCDTRILAVEEPESHLHPKLHAALAERFCELAEAGKGAQLLVETHSENILLRVQIAIAERKLSPDNVVVYWVRQFEDGRSKLEPVFFDEQGKPQGNWPPKVFKEDLEQARELLELQRGFSKG